MPVYKRTSGDLRAYTEENSDRHKVACIRREPLFLNRHTTRIENENRDWQPRVIWLDRGDWNSPGTPAGCAGVVGQFQFCRWGRRPVPTSTG
eukprot:1191148-Prorocentrum_minimum.AAC.1